MCTYFVKCLYNKIYAFPINRTALQNRHNDETDEPFRLFFIIITYTSLFYNIVTQN